MRETWYVLEDGTPVSPSECNMVDGALTHEKSGRRVAMRRPDCAMSTGVDVDATGDEGDGAKATDMRPAKPRRGYKTRETRAAD